MLSLARITLIAAFAVAQLPVSAARAAESTQPLQLGVLPNVSARVIVANYQPLRQLLERELKRPVEIVTAPDFKTFFQRTQQGEYDVVVTAANFARLAQTEGGYQPLGAYAPSIGGLLVMLRDRPVRDIQELRGSVLAMANPQSLVAMRGMHWLRDRGLLPGKDFETVKAANEDSLGQMLVKGDSRLAMLSSIEYRQIPDAYKSQLDVFTQFAEVPGFVWLANRRLSAADAAVFTLHLSGLDRAEEGRKFLAATGIRSWRTIGEAELAALDPVLPETRKMLGITK